MYNIYILCGSVLPACMCPCVCLLRPAEGTRSPEDTDGCELPCGCWEAILGPLKEQPLNHLTTEPSLHPLLKHVY